MAERMERVRRLLATESDYVPPVPVSVRPESGPAASRRVPCGVCRKSGKLGSRICPMCGGDGWRRRKRGEDEWDEYLQERVDSAKKRKRPPRAFRLDEDIRRLGFELQRLSRVDDTGEEVWEKALRERARQSRTGSYEELRSCLLKLEESRPTWYAAVRRVWLNNLPVKVMPRTAQLEMLGVAWLAANMRGEIRLPEGLELERRKERKRDIHDLAALGWKASRIAQALSMPLRKVKRALKEEARATEAGPPLSSPA